MHRFKPWPHQWATGLFIFAGTLSAWAAATGVTTALLEHEPLAVRHLMQQASAFEAAPDTPDNEWQTAVRYCEASRLGSLEAQYRLAMLYAFGKGVPASRPLAAALFSQASSQGHAEAGKMLDSIQLSSTELPACISTGEVPDKAPPLPSFSPNIDRFVLTLPAHKQWLIDLTTELSAWYALDPKLVLSVIAAESNFEQSARSPKAAMGLMQLIPDTAQRFNVRNAYNATQNLRGGMAYLRWLLSYYRGDIAYVLAAYNAGERRVDRHRGVPPIPETQAYVRKVMGLYGVTRHSFDETLVAASPWLITSKR